MTKLYMKPSVFVDTGFFKALLDPQDDFHKEASTVSFVLEKNQTKLITSNYILDESYTLLRVRRGLDVAKKLRELVFSGDRNVQVVRVQADDEANAWKLFLNNWSGLSFTDCTSFAVMKRLGLKEAASFDEHFSRAGFKIVG